MATTRKTSPEAPTEPATPDLIVIVEAVDMRALRQAVRDASGEVDRLGGLRDEAVARYEAAKPDRSVSATDLSELERQADFARADFVRAEQVSTHAERAVRVGSKVADRSAADRAAELIRDRIGKALSISIVGTFTVEPAGPVKGNGSTGVPATERSGPVKTRYEGPVDLDIVKLAVMKSLGMHGGGQTVTGAGPWTVVVSFPTRPALPNVSAVARLRTKSTGSA